MRNACKLHDLHARLRLLLLVVGEHARRQLVRQVVPFQPGGIIVREGGANAGYIAEADVTNLIESWNNPPNQVVFAKRIHAIETISTVRFEWGQRQATTRIAKCWDRPK